ncbi:general transcription factor IIH subunit 2-like [Oscarella lobularis]|uniref:general transcription factor IIH subunit 2-like n=1 Tax=Oscarella lobularis TaxID=121494 RepID=UPI0033144496
MDDDAEKTYTWETEYERTWEAIQEDEQGSLQAAIDEIGQKNRRKRMRERKSNIRLGMMRHLFLIVDLSKAMEEKDLRPSRLVCTTKLVENFIYEYFDQNPISQIGIIVTRNSRAEKLTDLGGNPKHHISALQDSLKCQGEPSLQNSLELAYQSLKHMPNHASREILVLMASLTTCDPGNIMVTCQTLSARSMQCSIIGLAAEVYLCKKVCKETKGQYHVVIDEGHYKDVLMQHVTPPPALADAEASLIRMGFPHHKEDAMASYSMSQTGTDQAELSTKGYLCPQCKAKYQELPVECRLCRLTLVSAPHLARSYHHLFPLPVFAEKQIDQPSCCAACEQSLERLTMVYECPDCSQMFCMSCDTYIHETLHTCPTCLNLTNQ